MRTPSRDTSGGRVGSTGKTGRALLSGVLAVCLAGSMAVIPIQADAAKPKPPVIPSKAAVERAKQAAAAKAGQVAAIEQQLAAANARLEQLGIQSGIADEAYNGAVYKLQQAKADAAQAADRAAKAEKTLTTQRQQIGRFAAASYQGGGDMAKLAPLFTADRAAAAARLGRYGRTPCRAAMQGVVPAVHGDPGGDEPVQGAGRPGLAKVKQATDEAAKAKKAAEAAEAAQAAAVTAMGVQRQKSIAQLAVLQNTSSRWLHSGSGGSRSLRDSEPPHSPRRRPPNCAAGSRRAEAAERAREAGRGGSRGAGNGPTRLANASSGKKNPRKKPPKHRPRQRRQLAVRAAAPVRRSTSRCPSSATCTCGAAPARPAGTARV